VLTVYAPGLSVEIIDVPTEPTPEPVPPIGPDPGAWVKAVPNASLRYVPGFVNGMGVPATSPIAQSVPQSRTYSGLVAGGGRIWLFGGAHQSYPGNDVEVYDVAGNIWTQSYNPDICTEGACLTVYSSGGTSEITPTGRPYSEHSYQNLQYDPDSPGLFGVLMTGTWRYTDATKTWQRLAPPAAAGMIWASWGLLQRHPTLGWIAIYTSRIFGIYRWNGTGWALHKTLSTANGVGYTRSAYMSERGEYLIQFGPNWWRYEPVANVMTRIANPPVNIDSFAYSQKIGKLIAIQHPNSTTFVMYTYDPATDVWALLPTSSTRPAMNGGYTSFWQQLAYDDLNDIFVLVKQNGASGGRPTETWLYKYGASSGTGTPPQTVGALQVGQGRTYTTPSAALAVAIAGQVIEVDPGTYHDSGYIQTNGVIVRGVGGRPSIDAVGVTVVGGGLGTYVPKAADVTLENLELHHSHGDGSQAGVRLQATSGVTTLKNLIIHDCDDGILGGVGGSLVVADCTIYGCGTGTGQNHNVYVGAGLISATFTNNQNYGAIVGHLLKSRAVATTVTGGTYNDTANASFEFDFPEGGNVLLQNVLSRKGPNADNSYFMGWGEEVGVNVPEPPRAIIHQLVLRNCVFWNDQMVNRNGASLAGQSLLVNIGPHFSPAQITIENCDFYWPASRTAALSDQLAALAAAGATISNVRVRSTADYTWPPA
jgi:hypothetical protein